MLMWRAGVGIALGLGVFAVVMPTAKADVLYNNIGAASSGMDVVSGFGPLSDSFSTGGSAADFTDLKILVEANAPDDGGSFTVSLLSDNSTSPGTVLDTLATILDSGLTTSLSTVDIPVSSIALTANTRYWIQLASGNTSALWSWSLDVSGVGVASEYFANENGVFSNPGNGPYQMEVSTNTSAVPEPGSLALLASGLVGLGLFRRRKRS